jgi:hypothetical protein
MYFAPNSNNDHIDLPSDSDAPPDAPGSSLSSSSSSDSEEESGLLMLLMPLERLTRLPPPPSPGPKRMPLRSCPAKSGVSALRAVREGAERTEENDGSLAKVQGMNGGESSRRDPPLKSPLMCGRSLIGSSRGEERVERPLSIAERLSSDRREGALEPNKLNGSSLWELLVENGNMGTKSSSSSRREKAPDEATPLVDPSFPIFLFFVLR